MSDATERDAAENEIDKLSKVLLDEFGGPTCYESACEMAIRLLRASRPVPALPEGWTIRRIGTVEAPVWELLGYFLLFVNVARGVFVAPTGEDIPVTAIRALLDAAERGTP